MQDTFTIQSIDAASKIMVVVFTINGVNYTKDLPFFTDQDADLLTSQLQAFAKELRAEFTQLTAAVEAADAGTVPAPSDAVNALTGQALPVDATPSAPTEPASSTTEEPVADPSTETAPADTTAPADASTTPADATPAPAESAPADSGTEAPAPDAETATPDASASTDPTAPAAPTDGTAQQVG